MVNSTGYLITSCIMMSLQRMCVRISSFLVTQLLFLADQSMTLLSPATRIASVPPLVLKQASVLLEELVQGLVLPLVVQAL